MKLILKKLKSFKTNVDKNYLIENNGLDKTEIYKRKFKVKFSYSKKHEVIKKNDFKDLTKLLKCSFNLILENSKEKVVFDEFNVCNINFNNKYGRIIGVTFSYKTLEIKKIGIRKVKILKNICKIKTN